MTVSGNSHRGHGVRSDPPASRGSAESKGLDGVGERRWGIATPQLRKGLMRLIAVTDERYQSQEARQEGLYRMPH